MPEAKVQELRALLDQKSLNYIDVIEFTLDKEGDEDDEE
jgi:hypothetical protein